MARREDADRHAVAGQVQDQQRHRDHRQPVADLRDELTGEEEPEVPDPQRAEGVVRAASLFATGDPLDLRGSFDRAPAFDPGATSPSVRRTVGDERSRCWWWC